MTCAFTPSYHCISILPIFCVVAVVVVVLNEYQCSKYTSKQANATKSTLFVGCAECRKRRKRTKKQCTLIKLVYEYE